MSMSKTKLENKLFPSVQKPAKITSDVKQRKETYTYVKNKSVHR